MASIPRTEGDRDVHLIDGQPVFSATDLVGFLACRHLTNLERAALGGLVDRPERHDPQLDTIRKRGFEHEQRYLDDLRAHGRHVTEIRPDASLVGPEGSRGSYGHDLRDQVRRTEDAIRRGDDVIYQAAFFDGRWRGHADFLLRVDTPSDLGSWSYEVADTKLAHHAKASALLQMCSYVEQLMRIQVTQPEWMHVALGGSARTVERFRVADHMAYYRWVKRRFEETVSENGDGTVRAVYPPETYPDPVEHCDVCRWALVCSTQWRRDDALPLVAGISRNQRRRLEDRGVPRRRALAVLPLPVDPPLPRTSRQGIVRVREQARLQVEGEDAGDTRYELLAPERREDGTVVPDRGLAALPVPSPGDLFFDMEGDPFAFDDGVEYLFGVIEPGPDLVAPELTLGLTDVEHREPEFHTWWAVNADGRIDRAGEKRAFEEFIDFVMARRARDPYLHVYHYGAYERGRMGRLSTMHATREEEVDDLLRSGVFVDLYRAVRQGVRASVESYSIKRLEPLYGFRRTVDLQQAGDSIVEFERWLEEGGHDHTILDTIRDYNRDDCLSNWRLRDWLEERRAEALRTFGVELPRPGAGTAEASEEQSEARRQVAEVAARLTADIGDATPDEALTDEQRGRRLLANLLDWHWREEKSTFWRFYELMGMSDDDLAGQSEPITGLTYEGSYEVARSVAHRYRFPPQDNDVRPGSEVYDPQLFDRTGWPPKTGSLHAIDQVAGTLEIKRPPTWAGSHPTSIVPFDRFDPREMRGALLRIGDWVAENGIDSPDDPYRATRDLLLANPPRVDDGARPGSTGGAEDPGAANGLAARPGESDVDVARRVALGLDGTTLPIQGPPGSGKTYSGAWMILDLVRAGRKVGITATSHKVIGNLLDRVCEFATREGVVVSAVQRANKDQRCSADIVELAGSTLEVREKLDSGEAMIAAGTPWLWSPQTMEGAVDTLFVDEAGQMSLANVVAVSQTARNVVLLGDPQQLQQPLKGAHPAGAQASALEHLLRGRQTIPPDRGLFLEQTRRLHPDVCAFTSEVFYEGRLEAAPGLAGIAVGGEGPLAGTGIRYVPVVHEGNTNESAEEAAAVAEVVRSLIGRPWTDPRGVTAPLALRDIVIVAPYNAHVSLVARTLADAGFAGARVGTVDKFQGQEAAVSIYSMATSTPEDAPRGMDFLYSMNRLNVATSRARAVALLVCSPALFNVACRTPAQMRLANAFCRLLEHAAVGEPRLVSATG